MKIRTTMCLAAALLLGATLPAAAQDGGSATAAVQRLAEQSPVREILRGAAALGLTRDQVRALESIDRELSARGDSALAALRAAGEAGPGRRLREARGTLLRARADAADRAIAILTPGQRARL
ncbi:MAG TPA: hypothetical protein VF613_19180 [Longimicrobium sp.]|jgi:hypothetical protein